MNRLKFFFIFTALIAGGFYLGSQAVIPGQGLFLGKVLSPSEPERRSPASPESLSLQAAFKGLDFHFEKGLWTLVAVVDGEQRPMCDLVEGIDTYAVTIQAVGVSESGEPVQIVVTGDCEGSQKVVVFDKAICKQSLWNLGRGIDLGDERRAKSVRLLVPMKKMIFFMGSLKVTYKDREGETMETSSSQQKILFSCESN